MYGSSRLGINTNKVDMLAENPEEILSLTLGNKLYEMSNHLGNVLTVINDIKVPQSSNTVDVDGYLATIVSTADYSPFGVQLDERTVSAKTYRYGFQGQEKDDELKGAGNSVNYTYRMHDVRLGRFFAVDPLAREFPWNSPYAFSENRVIDCVELEGLESFYAADGSYIGTINNGSTQIRYVSSANVESVSRNIRWANHQISIKGKFIWSNTKKALDNSLAQPGSGSTPNIFSSGQVKANAKNRNYQLNPEAVTGPVQDNTAVVMPQVFDGKKQEIQRPRELENKKETSGRGFTDCQDVVDGKPGETFNSQDMEFPDVPKLPLFDITPRTEYFYKGEKIDSYNYTYVFLMERTYVVLNGQKTILKEEPIEMLYYQTDEVYSDSIRFLGLDQDD